MPLLIDYTGACLLLLMETQRLDDVTYPDVLVCAV